MIQVGDIVRLRSGSPDLLVVKREGKQVMCKWVNAWGQQRVDPFNVESLVLKRRPAYQTN